MPSPSKKFAIASRVNYGVSGKQARMFAPARRKNHEWWELLSVPGQSGNVVLVEEFLFETDSVLELMEYVQKSDIDWKTELVNLVALWP